MKMVKIAIMVATLVLLVSTYAFAFSFHAKIEAQKNYFNYNMDFYTTLYLQINESGPKNKLYGGYKMELDLKNFPNNDPKLNEWHYGYKVEFKHFTIDIGNKKTAIIFEW